MRARPRLRTALTVAGTVLTVLAVLGLVELLTTARVIDPLMIAPPSRVLDAFAYGVSSGDYASALSATLSRLVGGLIAAVAIGVPLGILMGAFRPIRRALFPIVALVYPIPISLLIPLFLTIFGFTPALYMSLVALATGIPIVFSAADATARVGQTVIETGRTLGLGPAANLVRVIVPAAAPRIARGVFVAVSIGMLVLVTAEILSSSAGLGNIVIVAQRSYRIPDMYAGILLVGLVGLVVTETARLIAARLSRWEQPASRSP